MQQLQVIQISNNAKQLIILDQTQLPNHEEYLTLTTPKQMWDAIKLLQVRGAPAIGVFAGYAMAVLAQYNSSTTYAQFKEIFNQQANYLNTARPTAVNLSWALNRMKAFVATHKEEPATLRTKLIAEAKCIDKENLAMNQKIAEYGVTLLHEGDGILTHCNAGYLACLGYGTATAPMYLAHEKGMQIHVYSVNKTTSTRRKTNKF